MPAKKSDAARLVGPPDSGPKRPVPSNARLVPTIDSEGNVAGKWWWVPYGEGWEVPVLFEYGGGGPFEWTIWIQIVDGGAVCAGLRAWTEDGTPIRAEDLRRLPLGRLVQEGVLVASRPADETPKRYILWPNVEEARRQREQVLETHRRVTRNPREHGSVTPELLQEVARIYRSELAGGAPTAAVAGQLNYSRASAGRLVMRARKEGFLPPTEPRKARA
jgi:hypothetical protein